MCASAAADVVVVRSSDGDRVAADVVVVRSSDWMTTDEDGARK